LSTLLSSSSAEVDSLLYCNSNDLESEYYVFLININLLRNFQIVILALLYGTQAFSQSSGKVNELSFLLRSYIFLLAARNEGGNKLPYPSSRCARSG